MEKDYWNEFTKTGKVDSYLMYKQVITDEKEKEWIPLKQEELLQDGQITASQTQC